MDTLIHYPDQEDITSRSTSDDEAIHGLRWSCTHSWAAVRLPPCAGRSAEEHCLFSAAVGNEPVRIPYFAPVTFPVTR